MHCVRAGRLAMATANANAKAKAVVSEKNRQVSRLPASSIGLGETVR